MTPTGQSTRSNVVSQISTAEDHLKMFNESAQTSKMLSQLSQDRQSIINQGDAYIQRKNMKEAIRLANWDA